MKKTYYLLYKTTNLLNGKYYIGIHRTKNKNDSYLGSGKALKEDIKKLGKENFKRVILEETTSMKKLKKLESEIVTEKFLKKKNVYNLALNGGNSNGWINTKGLITVRGKDGKCLRVSVNDPRYLSGELQNLTKGQITVKDKNGNTFNVSKNDKRYLSGELTGILKNRTLVKNEKGKISLISTNDPRFLSGKLISISKNTVAVKDKFGNKSRVSINDPKYLNGELIGVTKGMIRICNLKLKANKIIEPSDFSKYNSEGWIKGRIKK